MTEYRHMTHEEDESRQAFLQRVAEAYDVPMNLIRYERLECGGAYEVPSERQD